MVSSNHYSESYLKKLIFNFCPFKITVHKKVVHQCSSTNISLAAATNFLFVFFRRNLKKQQGCVVLVIRKVVHSLEWQLVWISVPMLTEIYTTWTMEARWWVVQQHNDRCKLLCYLFYLVWHCAAMLIIQWTCPL